MESHKQRTISQLPRIASPLNFKVQIPLFFIFSKIIHLQHLAFKSLPTAIKTRTISNNNIQQRQSPSRRLRSKNRNIPKSARKKRPPKTLRHKRHGDFPRAQHKPLRLLSKRRKRINNKNLQPLNLHSKNRNHPEQNPLKHLQQSKIKHRIRKHTGAK